jgi:hypothetical protein
MKETGLVIPSGTVTVTVTAACVAVAS